MVQGSQHFISENILGGDEWQISWLIAAIDGHGRVVLRLESHEIVDLAEVGDLCLLCLVVLVDLRQRPA